MANRKARGKQPDLIYHEQPSAFAFWAYILKNDPSWLIRPRKFPLAGAPMRPFLSEQRSLVSRLAREKAIMLDAKVALDIQREREKSPLASKRELADWLEVPRHTIHRVLRKQAIYDRMLAHLEQALPQRLKNKSPHRSAKNNPTRRKT